ncbi:MAG: hypothetical protein ACTSSJ_03130 [Candidatus Odinarchaeia archaeon]
MGDHEIRENTRCREISKNEAISLMDEYIADETYKRIVMDKDAKPTFSAAYKDLFDRLFVFTVKLSFNLTLIISDDRSRFWIMSEDLPEP